MKSIFRTALAAAALMTATGASAQYYQIANQVRDLITPALTGGSSYKGFVDASVLGGIGENRATFAGVSTTQGFQYSSWFFMGAGLGIDVAVAQRSDKPGFDDGYIPDFYRHDADKTKAMIPVFSDFRFNIGDNPAGIQAFVDIKLGATWLIGSSYLMLENSCLGTSAQFYLKPSIGVRVPVSATNPRQALNFGVTYQLITSGNNYYWNGGSLSLNNIGLTIAFEW